LGLNAAAKGASQERPINEITYEFKLKKEESPVEW
jgi:hypothetical protein